MLDLIIINVMSYATPEFWVAVSLWFLAITGVLIGSWGITLAVRELGFFETNSEREEG